MLEAGISDIVLPPKKKKVEVPKYEFVPTEGEVFNVSHLIKREE